MADNYDQMPPEVLAELEKHYCEIIKLLGEDPSREGLIKTPKRVSRAMWNLTRGYRMNPRDVLLSAKFHEDYKQMVIVKDIDFFSLCEHHMLPFYGKVHIGYIPDGKVVGLSKLARTVEVYARRAQIQEQLTEQVASAIMEHLNPKGVMVMIEAEHMCMTMRGVQKPGTKTTTYVAKGKFEEDANLQQVFLSLLLN